jgi:hypothetical protein
MHRIINTRISFARNLDLHRMGDFLASGCIDAPDIFTAQWDADKNEWVDINFRDE